jgi:hypothetical protein
MAESKRERLQELDSFEEGIDDEGNIIPIEDLKDQLYAAWLEKATRTLRRIPEYAWLFSPVAPAWWATEQVAEAMVVSKKTVYSWCRDIIGARPGEGKAGYRIPRSGLIIFLADLGDEEPAEVPQEPKEVLTFKKRSEAPAEHPDPAVAEE